MESISCIHCGCDNTHTPPTNIVSEDFVKTTDLPCEDIASINAEVAHLDDQIDLLRTKRAALLCRVNDVESPIYSVPPEVLSRVLEMVAIDVSGIGWEEMRDGKTKWPSPHIPIILGSVSSYWRSVVHATPQIWTSMLVERGSWSTAYRDKKIAFIRYYLERARDLPLSIGFKILDTSCNNEENIKAVLGLLCQENPTQIKALHMINTPIQSFTMADGEVNKSYTQLETLNISQLQLNSINFTLPPLPKLRHLKLTNTPTIQFTTTTITCLHLAGITYCDCIRLLLLCRDTIVDFEVWKTGGYVVYNPSLLPRFRDAKYTLPKLETLRWEFPVPYQGGGRFILSQLHMPQMHTLHLTDYSPYQQLLHRINPTSSPLSVLALCCNWETKENPDNPHEHIEDGIKYLFKYLDTKKLIIGSDMGYLPWRQDSTDVILELLEKNCLPSLNVLSFPRTDPCHGDPDFHLGKLESLVDMLEGRLEPFLLESPGKHHESFVLELPRKQDGSIIKWGVLQSRIQALIDAGLLHLEDCNYELDMRKPTVFI